MSDLSWALWRAGSRRVEGCSLTRAQMLPWHGLDMQCESLRVEQLVERPSSALR